MKKLKFISVMALLYTFTVASMCEDDDDNSNPNLVSEVINIAKNGTWRVTLYNDSGQIETSDYNGYNFTFGANNALTATNGANTYNGTWSITDSNSSDDSPDNDVDFNIGFASPPTFEELSDDWDIVSYTQNKIELRDVSGGNGTTDLLTFEKN
jgi:hypothetical protein